jgi:hypothetical protein
MNESFYLYYLGIDMVRQNSALFNRFGIFITPELIQTVNSSKKEIKPVRERPALIANSVFFQLYEDYKTQTQTQYE